MTGSLLLSIQRFADFEENVHTCGISLQCDGVPGGFVWCQVQKLLVIAINQVPVHDALHPVSGGVPHMHIGGHEQSAGSQHVVKDLQQSAADSVRQIIKESCAVYIIKFRRIGILTSASGLLKNLLN